MRFANLMAALLASAVLAPASGALANSPSEKARDQAVKDAGARYQTDKAACDVLAGNAKDICVAEAKGREKVAKADAELANENSPKMRQRQRSAVAGAAYDVAKQKCSDLAGNLKAVCVKEAKAGHVKAVANAKVDRVSADSRHEAVEKRTEAREEAKSDKNDANYDVALQKCSSFAGTTKDTCVAEAKLRFNKK